MSLTGIPETDMMILMQLEDHELGPVCQANSYIRSLCRDPTFWYKRIIEKIEKSLKENLKLVKNLKNVSINGKQIENMRNFFGLTLEELNKFLNEIPLNGLYVLYNIYQDMDKMVNSIFTFDENKLPKYINKNELIFFLRREFAKDYFKNIQGKRIDIPKLFLKKDTPGYIYKVYPYIIMSEQEYLQNKDLGIRK